MNKTFHLSVVPSIERVNRDDYETEEEYRQVMSNHEPCEFWQVIIDGKETVRSRNVLKGSPAEEVLPGLLMDVASVLLGGPALGTVLIPVKG